MKEEEQQQQEQELRSLLEPEATASAKKMTVQLNEQEGNPSKAEALYTKIFPRLVTGI